MTSEVASPDYAVGSARGYKSGVHSEAVSANPSPDLKSAHKAYLKHAGISPAVASDMKLKGQRLESPALEDHLDSGLEGTFGGPADMDAGLDAIFMGHKVQYAESE